MHFRFLLLLSCLLFAIGGEAQTLRLDSTYFYPDSNIVHTGRAVRWNGMLHWTLNPSAGYTLNYSFGDGQSYSVTRTTSATAAGADTFSASHTYATAGTYNAKVVLRNALGAAVDSLIRPFSVGSGFVVSGRVYYDCTRNCLRDTGELGPGNNWVGLVTNTAERMYLTDSTGGYNIPMATGDTLFGLGTIPYNINTTVMRGCPRVPITTSSRSANLAIWLIDQVYIENLQVNGYACLGNAFELAVDIGGNSWTDGTVRIGFGDGWRTGYVSQSTTIYYTYYYQTRGNMNLSVDLYDRYSGGPYMRLTHPVQVDSCRTIALNPVHDANQNCAKDSAEQSPDPGSVIVRTKLRPRGFHFRTAGSGIIYSHYPGDSAWVQPQAYYFGSNYSEIVGYREACPPPVITDLAPDSLDIPFESAIKLDNAFPLFNQACYADTLRFILRSWLSGFPKGQRFHFIADYGDGTRDSTSFIYSSDTITLFPTHRYDSTGLMDCTFILRSDAGDADTTRFQLTVGNCYPAFVRAFHDLNKNCIQDAGEPAAANCGFFTAGGQQAGLDPATGFAQLSIWASPDSIERVVDYTRQPEQGRFFRTVTAAEGCPWPRIDTPRTALNLPLIEAPGFYVEPAQSRGNPCLMDYRYVLMVGIHGNHGRSYKLVHYAGDGINTDTFLLSTAWSNQLPVPWRTFPPGSSQPSYRIFDERSGALLSKALLPPLNFEDTCAGSGRLFVDVDGDCAFSPGDRPLAMQAVDVYFNGALQTVLTDSGGRFSTGLSLVADSLRVPDSIGGMYALACGMIPNPPVDTLGAMEFPYACAAGADLRILAAHQYFKPGAADTLYLYPAGHSCEAGPGILQLSLPAGLSYTGADLPGGMVSGGAVSWTIDTLRNLPDVIRVGLLCGPGAGAQTLCLDASLTGALPDLNPANNDFRLCDSLRSTIPEYYKSVSSDSMEADGSLLRDREIIYSLRVRNGSLTDTLRSVLLFDTLDAQLDIHSVRMLDADYSYAAQLMPGGVLRINSTSSFALAPSQEAAVRFSVMPQPGLPVGAVIRNRFSVVTDGVPGGESNTLLGRPGRVPSAISPIAIVKELRVYPVPADADGSFFIELPAGAPGGSYELLDARGAVCAKGNLDAGRTRVAAPLAAPGLYMVRVQAGAARYLGKMVFLGSR